METKFVPRFFLRFLVQHTMLKKRMEKEVKARSTQAQALTVLRQTNETLAAEAEVRPAI